MLIIVSSCKKDDPINEAEVLVKHIEASITPKTLPAYITASALSDAIVAGTDQLIIDIRSAEKWTTGHVPGAVNVSHKLLLDYLEENSVPMDKQIVIACYSGQSAAWGTALLRLAGYSNTKSLKFGMSSWTTVDGYDYWSGGISDDFVTQMVETSFPKAAPGDLPKISTGFEKGADILRARIDAIFAEGFTVGVSATDAFTNKDNWYIANYWAAGHYNEGHIPNSVMYEPANDPFTLGNDLLTLPSDESETVVVYCYTGQTSAFMAAYLRVLNYNAKTLKYGANSMFTSTMPGTQWGNVTVIDRATEPGN